MRIFTIRLNQKGGSDSSISDWAGGGFLGCLGGLDRANPFDGLGMTRDVEKSLNLILEQVLHV